MKLYPDHPSFGKFNLEPSIDRGTVIRTQGEAGRRPTGASHFRHAQQADFGASSNISEIIAEHRLCALPSDDVKRWLATAGVDLAALARRWQTRPLDIPRIDRVIFDGRGGFEFARYRQGVRDAGAKIFIVRNHIGDAIDLAAWGPPRPLALWIARGSMLGSENLFGFRMREGLEVHPTPFEWLLAGCEGVVILDPAKAAQLLRRAEPLQAASFTHGRNLKKLLDVKPPRILVPASAERRPPT
jgi:hypothetical protein